MRSFILLLFVLATTNVIAQPNDANSLPPEAHLVYSLNSWDNSFVKGSSKVISGSLLPLTIGIPAALYAYGALEVRAFGDTPDIHRYAAQSGIQTFVAVGATYGVVLVAKELFSRQRPYQAYPNLITAGGSSSDGSFPSGHSAGAAALATSLSLRYPTWYVITPSVLYTLWTGFSRINLGMHYLSDVLSGYAVGAGVALLVHALRVPLFSATEAIVPKGGTTNMLIEPTTQLMSISIGF